MEKRCLFGGGGVALSSVINRKEHTEIIQKKNSVSCFF